MRNESILLTREIEAIHHQIREGEETMRKQREELSASSANPSSTLTHQLLQSENSVNSTVTTPQVSVSPDQDLASTMYMQWSVVGMRKRIKRKQRHQREPAIQFIQTDSSTNIFDDNTFW